MDYLHSLHNALNPTHWSIHSESFRQTRRPRRVTSDTPRRVPATTIYCRVRTTTLNIPPIILISAKIAVTLLNFQMMQCSALAERIKRAGSCPSSSWLAVSLHADHQNTTLPCFGFINNARSRRLRAVPKTSHHLLNVGQSSDHLPNSGTCPGCVKELLIYQDQ